jgi:hypothetical protein
MKKSSALRNLHNILEIATKSDKSDLVAADVLLGAMSLEKNASNLISFYELLRIAKEEIKSINKTGIENYIQQIDALQKTLISNALWSMQWKQLAPAINQSKVILFLDLLADFFDKENTNPFLGDEFLSGIKTRLGVISEEILCSEVTPDLKEFINKRISNIITAIERYAITGIRGIEEANKIMLFDISLKESKLSEKDRKSKAFKSIGAFSFAMMSFLKPSNIYDIAGVPQNLKEFWIPQMSQLTQYESEVYKAVESHSNLLQVIVNAPPIKINREIPGAEERELKLLAPAEDEPNLP